MPIATNATAKTDPAMRTPQRRQRSPASAVSHWFRRNRGMAMGIVYVGVGLVGAFGPSIIKPITH
jgi:hypothetical protein